MLQVISHHQFWLKLGCNGCVSHWSHWLACKIMSVTAFLLQRSSESGESKPWSAHSAMRFLCFVNFTWRCARSKQNRSHSHLAQEIGLLVAWGLKFDQILVRQLGVALSESSNLLVNLRFLGMPSSFLQVSRPTPTKQLVHATTSWDSIARRGAWTHLARVSRGLPCKAKVKQGRLVKV